MRKIIFTATSVLALTLALPLQATLAQSEMVDGQVTKVDEPAKKITMRHGPIKKFGMDEGHTMVFGVQDPAILKQVKTGDKVKFLPDRVNGQFVVIKIEKVS
jgi:Cu(I)/Ag(I) efflux system periplasmic protein CusF